MVLFDFDSDAVSGLEYSLHGGKSSVAFVCDVGVFVFPDDLDG